MILRREACRCPCSDNMALCWGALRQFLDSQRRKAVAGRFPDQLDCVPRILVSFKLSGFIDIGQPYKTAAPPIAATVLALVRDSKHRGSSPKSFCLEKCQTKIVHNT